MTRTAFLFVLLLPLGCPQGGGGSSGGPTPLVPATPAFEVIGPASGGAADPDGADVAVVISGTITYERLPVTAAGLGAPVTEPAIEVVVEAAAHDDFDDVLASTASDGNGDYTLSFTTGRDFFVRARARAGDDRVFHNLSHPMVVHAVSSPILNRAAGDQMVDLHATHDLPDNRAGAFAILDTVRRLRESVSDSFDDMGPLEVFWSVGNIGTLTDPPTVAVTGTGMAFDGPNGLPAVFLIGGTRASPQTTDHDEFDETVIAHEWSHFLQQTVSRDNNFGGPHGGEDLIFTAAYPEGLVTALGCALLGERVYRDTVGYPPGATSVRFEFDCESGELPGDGVGYGAEFRIARVVWNMLSDGDGWPAGSTGAPAAIDKDDFFESFAALKEREAPYAIAWLPSLLQQLVDDGHLTESQADDLVAPHGMSFPPSGGADPFPALLTIGGGAETGGLDAGQGNPVLGPAANALWRLEIAAPQSVTLTLTHTTGGYTPSAHRLKLSVYDLERNRVALDESPGADKSVMFAADAGAYIVRVWHVPNSPSQALPVTFQIEAQ